MKSTIAIMLTLNFSIYQCAKQKQLGAIKKDAAKQSRVNAQMPEMYVVS